MRTPLIIDKIDASELARFYRSELTENVLPFWLEHGLDHEHGGWLTCVDREGKLYSTDKSVWFQGRGTWTFAAAFRQIEANPKYLQAATTGLQTGALSSSDGDKVLKDADAAKAVLDAAAAANAAGNTAGANSNLAIAMSALTTLQTFLNSKVKP